LYTQIGKELVAVLVLAPLLTVLVSIDFDNQGITAGRHQEKVNSLVVAFGGKGRVIYLGQNAPPGPRCLPLPDQTMK
jgi:hypothetical protein